MQLSNILLLTAATAASGVLAKPSAGVVNAVIREVTTLQVPRDAKFFIVRRDEAACTSAASKFTSELEGHLPPTPAAALAESINSYYMAHNITGVSNCQAPKITGALGSSFTSYESEVTKWFNSYSDDFQSLYSACSDVPAVSSALASAFSEAGTCTSGLNAITGSGSAATGSSSGSSSTSTAAAAPFATAAIAAAAGFAGLAAVAAL